MKIYVVLFDNRPSDVYSIKEKAMEFVSKYNKYFNYGRFNVGVTAHSLNVEEASEVWSLMYNNRLIGFYLTEKEAWEENAKYHKVQFDTQVTRYKIRAEIDEYWSKSFNEEEQKRKAVDKKFNEAWEELIAPIKHTLR